MYIGFNPKILIQQLLPPILRQPIHIAWLTALLKPIIQLWEEKNTEREQLVVRAYLTPQKIVLQAYLNRMLDSEKKRIKIIDSDELKVFVALNEAESSDFFIDGDGTFIPLDGEYQSSFVGYFTIQAPAGIDEVNIRSIVDEIKPAGIGYEIRYI